jgi:hypothetical protein
MNHLDIISREKAGKTLMTGDKNVWILRQETAKCNNKRWTLICFTGNLCISYNKKWWWW